MVIVDVAVMSLGRKYNFALEEEIPISVLITEICEVICQKENCLLGRPENIITLSLVESGSVMSPELTLSEYGVKNGSTLILT